MHGQLTFVDHEHCIDFESSAIRGRTENEACVFLRIWKEKETNIDYYEKKLLSPSPAVDDQNIFKRTFLRAQGRRYYSYNLERFINFKTLCLWNKTNINTV